MNGTFSNARSERLTAAMLFVILLATYVYVFPRWADPNQDSRLKMVVAVVDDGTFQIDKYLGTTVDYAKVGDHYYSDKAPGVAFLGIPVYAALRGVFDLPVMDGLMTRLANSESFRATLRADGSGVLEQKLRFAIAQVAIAIVVGVIPSAIVGVLIYLWLARVTVEVWPRLIVALSYGLLTPAYAYANTMYGHQLSAALLFGAFYWVSTVRRPLSIPALLGVGVLLSYAFVTEYPTALMVGILYSYTFYRLYKLGQWKGIIWVSLSAAVVAVGWMAYNTAIFGGPLTLGYGFSEQWVQQHHTGFMSLTLPYPEAMWGITFGVFRGLFVLAPWLLLALPGFWLWWRSAQARVELGVALVSVTAIFLFNSSSIMWWGGFAVGPRYLLPALPVLALPVIFVLQNSLGRLWLRLGVAVLLAWSLVTTWGLTLAEQAFPSDAIRNPLVDYALPNWQTGNIARNLGTIAGFRGVLSLVPLLMIIGLLSAGWWWAWRRGGTMTAEPQTISPSTRPMVKS
jgi:hypothetical protein